jgi:5-methylcytosine-specific restriction endonuclease McrA
MCAKCKEEIQALNPPKTRVKIPKHLRKQLPGNGHYGKKVSELTPEQLEEKQLHRRAYERLYRAARKEQGDTLKQYQELYHKIYQKNHGDKLRDYAKKYMQENPDWSERAWRRRRARKLSVKTHAYTTEDILFLWGTDCYLCGEPIDLEANRRPGFPGWELGLQLDHVLPLSAGGTDTLDNVKPTHGQCNIRKSATVVEGYGEVDESFKVLFDDLYGETRKGRPLKD